MKLLIELDEEYVKAIDKIKFLIGGRTNRKLQLEVIKAIKNGKALEQEPFKPMVEIDLHSVIKQKYIEREVLDKIRAEIAEIQLIGYATVDGKREIASRAVLQIIDKAENEVKDES